MNRTIPPRLESIHWKFRVVFLSNHQNDRGVTMEEVLRDRRPVAIINIDERKLTNLVDDIQIRNYNRDYVCADYILPNGTIPYNQTHDIFFGERDAALSFLTENYGFRLKSPEYY